MVNISSKKLSLVAVRNTRGDLFSLWTLWAMCKYCGMYSRICVCVCVPAWHTCVNSLLPVWIYVYFYQV